MKLDDDARFDAGLMDSPVEHIHSVDIYPRDSFTEDPDDRDYQEPKPVRTWQDEENDYMERQRA